MNNAISCPVCGARGAKWWTAKDGFDLYVCRKCSHRFVDPRRLQLDFEDAERYLAQMTNQTIESAEAYYAHLCLGEEPGVHTAITAELILKHVQLHGGIGGTTWLDVGSGSGLLVAQAQKLGAAAVGVEPGRWGQIAAREKRIEIVHAILTATTFQKKFDIISATDVLEHQPAPKDFLGLIRDYLAKDGRIYLSFPYGGSWRARLLRSHWGMVMPPTHCQFFSKKSFRLFAGKLGLAIVWWKAYNSSPFPGARRLGFSRATAIRLADALGWGDQIVVCLRRR